MTTSSSIQDRGVDTASTDRECSTTLRLAVAGGGTGGHLLPGIHVLNSAIESETTRLEDVLWFCSGRSVEDSVFTPLEERLRALEAAPAFHRKPLALESSRGGAPARLALGLRSLPAVRRARSELRAARSEVLLGLGGFTTLPAVLAAKSLGIPTALLEINAKTGSATRWLTPLAARVFHAWRATMPAVPGSRSHSEPNPKHIWTGPPLSPAFRAGEVSAHQRGAAKRELDLDPNRPLLAVLGGSQGAGGLNDFTRAHIDFLLDSGLQIVHQVGPGRSNEAAEASSALYRPFEFVDDVATLLTAADLVLARGGASTLAEIAARRVPAVIVPYPHHADRHQECNARELGAGVRLALESTLTAESAAEIARLVGIDGRSARASMSAELAARLPEPDAAGRILDELTRLAQKHKPKGT